MALYVLDSLLYNGREYSRGEEIDVPDELAADLKERELVSTSRPAPDEDPLPADHGDSADTDYESMSKESLLDLADARDIDVPKSANKGDIIAALEASE